MAFVSSDLVGGQRSQSIMNTRCEQYCNDEKSFSMSTIPLRRPMVESPREDEETSETTATDNTKNKSRFITMYEAKRLKLEKPEDGGDNNGINCRAMRESRRTFKVNEQIGQLRTLLQDGDFPLPPAASKYHVLQSCEKYIQQLVTRTNQMETKVKPPPFFGISSASSNFGNLSLASSTIGITNTFQESATNPNSSSYLDEPFHQTYNGYHDHPSKDGYVDDSNYNYNDIHDNKCNINHNNATIPTTTTTTKTVDIITTTTTTTNNSSRSEIGLIDYEHILETSDLPIAIASADGQLLRANPQFFTVTGYDPQDIGAMTLFSMAIPAYRKQLFEAVGASLVAVLSSKKVSDHPLVVLVQSKTGHPLHMNISAVPQSMHDVNAFLNAPKNILCCAILPEFNKSMLRTTDEGQSPMCAGGGTISNNCNELITGCR